MGQVGLDLDAVVGVPEGQPSMGPGYERIQAHLYAVDPWELYVELERELQLGQPAHRVDYAVLVDALDVAEDRARQAHRLYCHACVALEAYEGQVEAVEGAMRQEAAEELGRLKAAGAWPKQVTDADVVGLAAQRHPEEWRSTRERRAKAKRAVEHFKWLAERWAERSKRLDTMVRAQRRT